MLLVEAQHARRRRHGAESARGARTEEAEARLRGQAQSRGDIHADGDRSDQLGAAHTAAQLGGGQRRRQGRGHGVDDRGLVQAVVFLVVHLPGVDERRGRRGQSPLAAPDRHGGIAPAGRDADQPFPALDRRARDADAEAVEHVDLGAPNGSRRQIGEAGPERMGGEACGSGHAQQPFPSGDDATMAWTALPITSAGRFSPRDLQTSTVCRRNLERHRHGRIGPG